MGSAPGPGARSRTTDLARVPPLDAEGAGDVAHAGNPRASDAQRRCQAIHASLGPRVPALPGAMGRSARPWAADGPDDRAVRGPASRACAPTDHKGAFH